MAAAADADVAVIFAGLPERYESEGYDRTTLAYYEPELHDFYAESGTYQICVGASSRDLRLTGLLEWQAAQPLPVHFTAASTLKQVVTHLVGAAIIGPILQRMAAAAGGATGKRTMMLPPCP